MAIYIDKRNILCWQQRKIPISDRLLEEYIKRHKQRQIISSFGTVHWDPSYDYKAERRRKRA